MGSIWSNYIKSATIILWRRMRPSVDFDQLLDAHIGVNLRRLKLGVSEQLLDKARVRAAL